MCLQQLGAVAFGEGNAMQSGMLHVGGLVFMGHPYPQKDHGIGDCCSYLSTSTPCKWTCRSIEHAKGQVNACTLLNE